MVIQSYQGELAGLQSEFRSRAQKEAGMMRPPSQATDLDDNEAQLLASANKHVSDENYLFEQALIEAGRTATENRTKLAAMRSRTEQILGDTSLEGKLESQLSADRGALERTTERRLRVEAEYNWFRARNGIVEEAVYPDSRIHHFGLVSVIFLAEAIANAFFYRNQGGLLGGFMVAVVISVLNLGLATILGWAFRYKNLSAPLMRATGWAAITFFVVSTVFFGALFASFRSEYQLLADPGDPTQLISAFGKAWPLALGIFNFRFHFIDIFSFLLFWVSLLISCMACWKGYTSDDKHPGYSDKDRVLKGAISEQLAAEQDARARISAQLERAQGEVESVMAEPKNMLDSLAGRDATLRQLRSELLLRVQRIADDFKLVIQSYRQANVAIRTTPPPSYFQELPQLTPALSENSYEDMRRQLAEIAADARSAQGEFKEALSEKKRDLQSLSSKVLNDTLPSFLRDVRKNAEATISRQTPTIHLQSIGAA